ncbi:hypothetical protein BG006_007620 [Podila minutissima]|uniref:Lipase n=1 Tax=Podila minutissima TaxID=64525 RepID=A0A9P5SRE1_9FUNG|nr:hypothetical protein BG006_007620 [Podila minutissima]
MRITTLSLMLALGAINLSTTLAQSGSFVINYQGPSEPEHQLSVLSMMAGAVEPEDPSYDPKVTDYTDWSCKPSKAHPYPVIMLHGLLAPSFTSWAYLAQKLSENGYCVFQFLLGNAYIPQLKYGMLPNMDDVGGLTDIRDSAKELDAYVDKVVDATGATQVDLIGHSEGTVVPRWYLRYLDGAARTRSLVSISPIGRGTSLQGLLGVSQVFGLFDFLNKQVAQYCPACVQLLDNSDFMQELYEDDQESVPGVRYLNLVTRNDQLVTPFTRGLMKVAKSVKKGVKKTVEKTIEKTVEKIEKKLQHPLEHGDQENDDDDDDEDEDDNEDQDTPKDLVMKNDDIQNMVLEDYCDLDATHSNHFALFRAPFTFSAIDAFLSPWEKSISRRELVCSLD